MGAKTLRHSLHLILHNPTGKHPFTVWINRLLALVIIANVLAVALETVPSLYKGNEKQFNTFEAVSTFIFLVEYLARLWCSVEQQTYRHPFLGRLRWSLRPVAILDAIVIATFFAPIDLRFLRLARVLRLLRVLNLNRIATTYEQLKASIAKRIDLLLVSSVLMVIALFSSAALVYIFEHEAQPNTFTSIPATIWWSVMTLTTVGYGDMVPITTGGKICAALTAVFGIGIFALPAAILTSAVIEADGRSGVCPHCGKPVH